MDFDFKLTWALALSLPVLACGTTPASGDDESSSAADATAGTPMAETSTPTSPPGTTGSATPPADSGGTTSLPGDSSEGEEDDPTNPPVFDQGVIPDAPPIDTECTKVDFLFIIDNSSSMATYQANLVANFPAFINGIQGSLDTADSYHVGVITTDEYGFNVAGCTDLSSLVVQTGGSNSSSSVCGPFTDGGNFMTHNDDLEAAFSCAAQVGTSGDGNERPMQALVEAVQGLEAGPGGCNQGFLREDSLLVVVNIGDESDNSPGTPMDWYDAVVAARSGIPENVVILSIIDGPGNPCGFGQSAARQAFTALWGDNGFEVPICIADYEPYFLDAIDVVDVACENYIPPAG
ncbi:MAG: hypothetical protein AAF799_21130 [Myxococcota bacterium]